MKEYGLKPTSLLGRLSQLKYSNDNFRLAEKYTITELCNVFGISRSTAYRLIDRYEKKGLEGLLDQFRAPGNHPNKTKQVVVDQLLQLKEKHKKWGA